jgi:hypothetical protein
VSQSVAAVRAALLSACQTLYASEADTGGAPVLVTLGPPGSYQPDYLVLVAVETRQPAARLAMGVNQREAEIDTVFSCYVPGDEGAAATAADAAEHLVDAFDAYVKANKELGGACMDATVTNIVGPSLEAIEHPESHGVTGRLATSVVTVTARVLN